MTSGRAGVVYKPRTEGSIYLGYGTSFNPSAEGLSLACGQRRPRARADRELRSGHEVGRVPPAAVGDGGAVPHREDQRAHAGRESRRPADRPRRRTAGQGFELGVSGRIRQWWTAIANYAFMHSEIDASNTPTELDNDLALTPEHTVSIWTTFELPRRISTRRRRAVHGRRVPQRHQHRRGAELLADQRARLVRGQHAPHAAAQRHRTWPTSDTSIASAAATTFPGPAGR